MKTKHIIIYVWAMLIAGCSNNVNYGDDYTPKEAIANAGRPTITAIYDVADTELTTPITSGYPGQNICIVGENLNFLKSLKFNTVEADVSITYTMSTKAYVQIPTEFSHETVNTIEYTTDMGTVSFAFPILLPALGVYSLSNDFQAAGQEVTIYGANFDYYGFGEKDTQAAVLVNGKQVSLRFVSADALRVVIPDDTPDNSTISVRWQDGDGETKTKMLPFRPTATMLIQDITQVKPDKYVTLETDADVTSTKSSLGRPHLHFSGNIMAWSWIELNFSQTVPDIYNPSAVSDYEFVFELLTANKCPLASEGYEFAWNNDWNNSYKWSPSTVDTKGEWTTVRLPLSAVAPKGFGEAGAAMTFSIGFQPTYDYSADFRLGNFRIQKRLGEM